MKSTLLSLAICLSFGLISSVLASSPLVTHGKDATFEKNGVYSSSHMLKLAAVPSAVPSAATSKPSATSKPAAQPQPGKQIRKR